MKTVITQLKDFIKNDFEWKTYTWAFFFISISITVNYVFKFQSKYIQGSQDTLLVIMRFFMFYAFAWFAVAMPKFYFSKRLLVLREKEFWIKILVFIGLVSVTSGFSFKYQWFQFINDDLSRLFITKMSTQIKCILLYTLPIILLCKIFDKDLKGYYGLNLNFGNGKIYLSMLAIIGPLIILASFTPDFIQAYPRFRVWQFETMSMLPPWASTSIFELFYVLDFAMTEWMFRGALVIGMVTILGKDAILPMASMYVFLHFGKPLGETISSFFGGYFLGVLAYTTRHIWGGVILHAGIALLMELMGLFQFYVLGIHR